MTSIYEYEPWLGLQSGPLGPAPAALRLARTLPGEDPLRARLEAACAHLEAIAAGIIAELDLLVPDGELEPQGDDEPTLGATTDGPQSWWAWTGRQDLEEDPSDGEPWLGSVGHIDQRHWNAGGRRDLEHDTADDEPLLGRSENVDQSKWDPGSDDAEYSLGAANPHGRLSQVHWGQRTLGGFVGGDAEEQCEDEGGACEDEGAVTGDDEYDYRDARAYRYDTDQRFRVVRSAGVELRVPVAGGTVGA